MTECERFKKTKQDLGYVLHHVKEARCTQCAQEIMDAVPIVLEMANAALRAVDTERSELEADRIREHRADQELKRRKEENTDNMPALLPNERRPPQTTKALGKLRDPHDPGDGGF